VTGNVPHRLAPFMVLPCVVLLALFAYRPVLASVELSLFGSDIVGRPTRFVGLEHYPALFTEPDLRRMVLVTLAITTMADLDTGGAALDTGSDGNAAVAAFTAGRVAMMFNSSGAMGGIVQSGMAGWSALPYPLSGDRTSSGALIGGSAMWLVGPGHSAAEQVASWKVISYLASAPAQEAFTQGSGYAPVNTAVDASSTEQEFLAQHPNHATLSRQFADTPAVPATAGCLSGAMPGIRADVVDRMQAAFSGITPIDAALDEAERAATNKISAYREQAGR
jgi:sn-glycerol 3-phosphate transport system substrate-binding protein